MVFVILTFLCDFYRVRSFQSVLNIKPDGNEELCFHCLMKPSICKFEKISFKIEDILKDFSFFSVLRYEPHRFHDAYLQIQIKDRGFLGNGLFLGEAFLPLNELRLGDLDQRLSDLPQIQLPLSKPTGYGENFFLIK